MADEKESGESSQKADSVEESSAIAAVIRQNQTLIDKLPKDRRADTIAALIRVQKSHSGPLPAPDTIRAYAETIPNGGERVMVMAEKEQNHRHNMNTTIARRELNQSGRSQIFGFILGVLAIGGGIFLSYTGKETAGLATIIGALVALVAVFVVSKKTEEKN
ncbi:MAG: DUF2335 domain-containing protein [Mucilaginibacter polytrichastri]|nr:DUF2335 domain-containing protein [Mucilaginibacter polytrichastri]